MNNVKKLEEDISWELWHVENEIEYGDRDEALYWVGKVRGELDKYYKLVRERRLKGNSNGLRQNNGAFGA